MQVLMKIAEKQRKTRAGFIQLMNYISRDSFKTFGVGINDDKNIAIRQCLINKDLHKKNRDGKDRFTYHEIFSFGADVPIEKVIEIMEEFCTENFYDKGFNSFFAVHTDTDNIHCHVIADNVNFETGNLIHSVTEKQYESMSEKKKEKNETFVYEHQRKLFEDICIKHGLDISLEERYEYMHEQKIKEGRKWLTKEQYRAIKDKDSWSNEIKDRLEQIYKDEDITEDNIKDIANKYGLEVTRHNRDKKYITFALIDEQGKRTNQKLKLVQELNKKKKKSQDEVTEDTVKLAVKLDTLEMQEKELKKDSGENIFIYDNFFFKRKEIEKEQEEIKEVNTYTVEDSTKSKDFEKEKEYKNILENFFEEQEEKKKEQDSKAKKLEQEIKDLEKAEIQKITESDEVLRRLNIEEEERQAEAKANSKKPKIDNRPVIFNRLKDYKALTDELEILEFERDHRLTYSNVDIEKDFNNAVYLAFYNLISRKVEFNNEKEADRANQIMENIENPDDETIKRNLNLLDELIKDNEKEYQRLKKNNWEDVEETDLETTDEIIKTDEEIKIEVAEVAEIVESKQEITSSKPIITVSDSIITKSRQELTSSNPVITESNSIITNTDSTVTNSEPIITESKQEEQQEKHDLEPKESKQVDLDSLMSKIDSYELAEKYKLFDTLPPFQVIQEDIIYDSSSGEGNLELAKYLIINTKGEEYWDNMNPKDITKWQETGVFTIYYLDNTDNFKEYNGYEDYSKSTIKQFLKENTTVAEELAKQYMPTIPTDSKKKEQDSKSYEDKEKDREYDFN